MKAQVITPWAGDGSSIENANRPKVADDHNIQTWTDVTGQPSANLQPNPNMYIVEITCDQTTLDAIESDNNYEVLWSE